jgi:Tol biopolymer transport system component
MVSIMPIFSPDGRKVVFASNASHPKGAWNLHELTTDGGQERPLLQSNNPKRPCDFSPDGRLLLYREDDRDTLGDLKVLPLFGERLPRAFMATRFDEQSGAFSPDGRWVAYSSDESGRQEIYVASFPEPTRRYRVSSQGGTNPRWSRDSREFFYLAGGKSMMAVSVKYHDPELVFGPPKRLFDVRVSLIDSFHSPNRYDVSADGRFLVAVPASNEGPPPLVLVFNWAEQLKKHS